MADARTTILRAVAAADRLHQRYETESLAEKGEGRIDVFRMLLDQNIPLVFRPLRGLLGAYLDEPAPGIIVTTQRPLSVQRFTAAHEFGHAILEHSTSLDDSAILARTPFADRLTYDLQEAAADAFASQLLVPRWLIVKHMLRQNWSRDALQHPEVVYQLSLRMGVSYLATCHAARFHGVIDHSVLRELLGTKPLDIKRRLADDVKPATWHGDVWVVTERDQGLVIEGSRSDLVLLRLAEHSGSGYVWRFDELVATGMRILADNRTARAGDQYVGGLVDRSVIAQPLEAARGHAQLDEVRPWLPMAEPLHSISMNMDLSGPVPPGLLEAERRQLLRVA